MKKNVLLFAMLLGIMGLAQAQDVPSSIIDINNVRGRVLGTGNAVSFSYNDNLSWEVPKGSGNSSLFQYSLWVGGKDVNTEYAFEHVWNVTRAQIDDFIVNHGSSDYVIPEDILTWPAHGPHGYAENLAPFVDVNNDGQQIKKDYFCFRHFTQSSVWDIFVLDLSTNGFGVSCELKP